MLCGANHKLKHTNFLLPQRTRAIEMYKLCLQADIFYWNAILISIKIVVYICTCVDRDNLYSRTVQWKLNVFVSNNNQRNITSGGVGAVVKISASQSWGPQFDSRPGRGLNIWVTFFPAKVHSAFHPYGVGKMSTSIHGLIWSGCHLRQYMLPVPWGKTDHCKAPLSMSHGKGAI